MRSLTRADLRVAQNLAIPFIKAVKKCAVFAEMGVGKTGASITAIVDLIDQIEVHRTLVIAPLRVAKKTWPDEFKTWEHARDVSYRCLWNAEPGPDRSHKNGEWRIRHWEKKIEEFKEQLLDEAIDGDGSPKSQARIKALKKQISLAKRVLAWGYVSARHPEDVHIVNRENIAFLVTFWGKFWPYDLVIFDESSGLRNGRKALRWRALRKVMPYVERFVELTGTPMPKGYMGLWAQVYLLDGGKRLGTSMEAFKKRFFYQEDYHGYKWELKPGAGEAIQDLIKDVCLTLRAKDYMDLPDTIYNNIPVVLTDEQMRKYKELEKKYVLELSDGGVIEAANAAVLGLKLMQLANGIVYDEDKREHVVHEAKLDALQEYVEEQQGRSVLIAYWFKHDLAALRKRFPHFAVFTDDDDRITDEWNAGRVPGLFLHPQSGGHGLNIQFGGRHILWYGPIHDLELYQQLNARLAGARATGTTFIDHLVAVDTADEAILESTGNKAVTQDDFLDAMTRIVQSCS